MKHSVRKKKKRSSWKFFEAKTWLPNRIQDAFSMLKILEAKSPRNKAESLQHRFGHDTDASNIVSHKLIYSSINCMLIWHWHGWRDTIGDVIKFTLVHNCVYVIAVWNALFAQMPRQFFFWLEAKNHKRPEPFLTIQGSVFLQAHTLFFWYNEMYRGNCEIVTDSHLTNKCALLFSQALLWCSLMDTNSCQTDSVSLKRQIFDVFITCYWCRENCWLNVWHWLNKVDN